MISILMLIIIIIGGDEMKYTIIIMIFILMCFSGCSQSNKEINNRKIIEVQQEKNELAAEAFTQIYDKSENRMNNLRLAAMAIDGTVVDINEVFSFNAAVGKRSEERGYKKAPVIVEEKREYDYGGGVCQLSSTIFQAVKKAGLDVVERHEHKKEVDYAKKGEDAAVDYDTLDLKFVNNTYRKVIINAEVDDEIVLVRIINQ